MLHYRDVFVDTGNAGAQVSLCVLTVSVACIYMYLGKLLLIKRYTYMYLVVEKSIKLPAFITICMKSL